MDSMLKKIKSKYLKYLLYCVKEKTGIIVKGKFQQSKEVRNLDIFHNRDEFINLTVMEFLRNTEIFDLESSELILGKCDSDDEFFHCRIKVHYFFDFLQSEYFRKWIIDPVNMKKNVIWFYGREIQV